MKMVKKSRELIPNPKSRHGKTAIKQRLMTELMGDKKNSKMKRELAREQIH